MIRWLWDIWMSGHRKASRAFGQAGDGRELELLELIQKTIPPNQPQAILNAMDKFAWRYKWMMNVGDVKGKILDDVVDSTAPKVALELGTYCGYSGLRIASHMQPGSHLYSIEKFATNHKIATQIFEHAGMAEKVTCLNGVLETLIPTLRAASVTTFDFVFIDHRKDFYVSDLLLLRDNGFLRKGTVICADNVGNPGAPDYLELVETDKEFETVRHNTRIEYSMVVEDIVTVSTFKGPAAEPREESAGADCY